jgi:hypothetical protein
VSNIPTYPGHLPFWPGQSQLHARNRSRSHSRRFLVWIIQTRSGNLHIWYLKYKLDESEALARQVLDMRQTTHDPDHRDTLESFAQLPCILLNQNKVGEAGAINREALAHRSRILGRNHPETISASSSLAKALNEQAKYEHSEELNGQALNVREKILGKARPATILNMHGLAHSIYCQGWAEEALVLSLQATWLAEKVVGLHHPMCSSVYDFYSSVTGLRAIMWKLPL